MLALLLVDGNLGGLYVDRMPKKIAGGLYVDPMPKKIAKKQHTAATEKMGD